MNKVVIAYVPVLHEGYRKFFEKHSDAETLCILGKDIVEKDFPHLQKEIRALEPELMSKLINGLGLFQKVVVITLNNLGVLAEASEIVLPNEDVSREFAEKYLKNKKVIFDNVFLRWDKHKSMEERPAEVDQKISVEEFDKSVIRDLQNEAEKSSDWWRRTAAAVIKNGKVILTAHNKHWPSEHSPYSDGDPRNNFHKGVGVELSTSAHAEASVIAEAARIGEALEGASMYAVVFPCPPCAKLIAGAGIKKLYYSGGYVVLDQDKILKDKGVEIIYVDMK